MGRLALDNESVRKKAMPLTNFLPPQRKTPTMSPYERQCSITTLVTNNEGNPRERSDSLSVSDNSMRDYQTDEPKKNPPTLRLNSSSGNGRAQESSPKAEGRTLKKKPWGKVMAWSLAIVYIIVPLVFSLSPWIRRQIIFLHHVNFEFYLDLSSPAKYQLDCAKFFSVQATDGGQMGAWHVPPKSLVRSSSCRHRVLNNSLQDSDFDSGRPVILYFHGTGFNRAATFRRYFYKTASFSSMDCHVVSFDYRGYGDSTHDRSDYPNVETVLDDADTVYRFLLSRVKPTTRIIFWGHSLGSAVAVQLAYKYAHTEFRPTAVVLESTFTNMLDAVYSFPFSALHRFWPGFDHYVAKVAGYHPDTRIANDDKMSVVVSSPVLILHAADDIFLSVELGRKIYRLANEAVDQSLQRPGALKLYRPMYVEFDAELGYGHKASLDPGLPDIVNDFFAYVERQTNVTL